MIYVDTSALLAFTMAKRLEPARFQDKIRRARLFSALQDATDLPHAIAAHTAGCTAIVGYDEHFRAISGVIDYKTPEEIIAAVESG